MKMFELLIQNNKKLQDRYKEITSFNLSRVERASACSLGFPKSLPNTDDISPSILSANKTEGRQISKPPQNPNPNPRWSDDWTNGDKRDWPKSNQWIDLRSMKEIGIGICEELGENRRGISEQKENASSSRQSLIEDKRVFWFIYCFYCSGCCFKKQGILLFY